MNLINYQKLGAIFSLSFFTMWKKTGYFILEEVSTFIHKNKLIIGFKLS